jgi:transcriptional regulator with XRE-family HTH domain
MSHTAALLATVCLIDQAICYNCAVTGGGALGGFIRAQRRLAKLSVRQLAELADVSNAYLSQVERGLYRPSAQVLKNLAGALQISAETMYAQAGLLDESVAPPHPSVEEAISLDPKLTDEQKSALLGVYRGFLAS